MHHQLNKAFYLKPLFGSKSMANNGAIKYKKGAILSKSWAIGPSQ